MSGDRMRAHLKFLASDLLEGRGTGQRGGEVAAAYIATPFELMGLKPGAADGTYYQKVPLMGITTESGTRLGLANARGGVTRRVPGGYVAWSRTEGAATDQKSSRGR